MTTQSPEERAEKLVSEGMQEIEWDEHYGRKTFIADIATAIREAELHAAEEIVQMIRDHYNVACDPSLTDTPEEMDGRMVQSRMAVSVLSLLLVNAEKAIRSRSEKP